MDDTEGLVAFVTERLAEDEARSAALLETARHVIEALKAPRLLGREIPGWHYWPDVEAMCSRALRDAEAGRKLLREYERLLERKESHEANSRAAQHYTPFTAPGYPSMYDLQREGHFLEQAIPLAHGLVVAKADAWNDHPGYRVAWSQRVRPWPSPS